MRSFFINIVETHTVQEEERFYDYSVLFCHLKYFGHAKDWEQVRISFLLTTSLRDERYMS